MKVDLGAAVMLSELEAREAIARYVTEALRASPSLELWMRIAADDVGFTVANGLVSGATVQKSGSANIPDTSVPGAV